MKDTTTTSNRCLSVAIVALLVAIFAVYVVVRGGLNSGSQPISDATPQDLGSVARDGKLKVAVVSAPPVSFIEPSTKLPGGYAVDVVRAIAGNSKIELEFVASDWGTMGAALSSGKADVVVGPIFFTEGRAREFALSTPLFAYAIVAVVPKNSNLVRTISNLRNPGLRIAVGRGGFDAEFVSKMMPKAKQTVFPPDDPYLPALEVVAGRADLALMDFATAKRFVTSHSETEVRFEDAPISIQLAGFMYRQRDRALRDFVDVSIRNLDLSGELQLIDEKYFAEKAWFGRISQRPVLVR